MIRKTITALLVTAGLCAVSASPQIKFDKTTFSSGSTPENTVINAEFKYTNTGTEPLRISNVRVSCGCTVVGYDTVIAPGKTGSIKPKVDTKGFRVGQGSRSVTVTSNASNTPTQTLTIDYVITAPIELSHSHVHFEGAQKTTLFVSSAKKDLKVSSVVFTPNRDGTSQQWASSVAMNMKYAFVSADSTRADGHKVYRLELDAPPGGSGGQIVGEIKIATNHPERREIILRAD